MTYGTKLRKIRLEKNLSQAEVANSIGLDQSTYSRIESDLHEPKASVLMSLAKYYQVDISALYPPIFQDKQLTTNYLQLILNEYYSNFLVG
jgi:transcriptional regulator with XRE-family HTH domain